MENIDLKYNIDAHNKYASVYQKKHTEIFNDIEQPRLNNSLQNAINFTGKSPENICVLDYGCGSGNLTHHLLSMGLNVTSADISTEFLKIINETYSVNPQSKTFLLNGIDLSEIQDEQYDMVCLYSVLHHIPDYIASLKEIIRVTSSGGIIYIDHERSPNYWQNDNIFNEFKSKIPNKLNLLYYFNVFNPNWYSKKYKKIKNPRWQAEGDIHVWQDDHIEWDKIDKLMESNNMEKVSTIDYLSYVPEYPINIFNAYKEKCNDMRSSIYRKK